MPRFSAKSKEILDELWYNSDFTKANKIKVELKDPLDIAFAKLFFASYYRRSQRQDASFEILTEVETENKKLNDQFIQFMINFNFCLYYMGIMGIAYPLVSKEQLKKYLAKTEQSFQDIDYKDDWEKYYCIGWYYMVKALVETVIKDDFPNAIGFQKKCIEAWSNIPREGEYYSASGYNNLGLYYLESGDLKEAEKSYNRALDVFKQYNNEFQLSPLGNLAWLNAVKGDLQKAMELNIQEISLARRLNSAEGIYGSLTNKGSYLFQDANYDEALKAHQESLVHRKQYGDRLEIFWGYFKIFHFYYQRFRITKDKGFLKQAEQTLTDLQELSNTHSDNKTMVNYTNYAHSLVLKYGNIIKKGNAIVTLQELLEKYPNDIEISLNLLELLFEDVIQSEDQDTINEIDELMGKISKIPLRNSPHASYHFISQQIFLAKYSYYIKGDLTLGLNILNDAKDHINTYKLDNLVNELDAELEVLEKELTRWDHVDKSFRDRINASEFNKYIEEALSTADKQM